MNVYRVIMAIYVNLSFITVWRCDFVRYKEAPLLQDAVSLEYQLVYVNSPTRSVEQGHRVTRVVLTGLAGVCQVLVYLMYLSSMHTVNDY